jgi:uncharacterized protein (TIGR01777 family)
MSRVRATSAIAAALAAQPTSRRPNVWVAGSAVGIYGDRPAEVLSEDAVPGPGFLAGVVRAWEGAAAPAAGSVRLVLARTGMVVADGGAFAPLIVAARRGVSVSVGRGDQWWPWVALADEVRAIEHLLSASQLSGPVNLVGPVPATSGEIAADLAHRFRRRISLRLPPSPMRWVLGDAARDLLLASQLAIPARLNADRFEFRAPTVGEALGFALGQVR